MARHAEDTLRCASIAQVLDFALAVSAPEAVCAESLVASQDGQVLDLVAAMVAAVRAVVTNQGSVSEEKQIGIRVEERAARVATEAVNVPSVSSCALSVCEGSRQPCALAGTRANGGQAHRARRLCPLQESGVSVSKRVAAQDKCRYLSASLARVHDIVLVAILVEQRFRIAAR